MKKIYLLFAMILSLLGGVTQANAADEITVYDGTTTNGYVPMYGYYADTKGALSEFIIPADDLADLEGAELSALKFYTSESSVSWGAAEFQVYVKEVADGALNSGFATSSDATTVYEGSLSISNKEMNITFTNNYSYNGGNLLVGILVTTKGSYVIASFYGTGDFDDVYARYRGSASGNGTAQYFIPKTTITYESAAEGPGFKVVGYSNGDTYSMGLIDPKAKKTITVKNPGTESVTANIATTGGFTAPASVTLAAKEEKAVEITTPETLGAATGTITFTPTATTLDAVTVNLAATVKDPSKMFVDFADNVLAEDWTTVGIGSYTTGSYASSYKWDFSNGYALYKKGGSSSYSSSYYNSLVSPFVQFADGEKIMFLVRKEVESSFSVGYLRVDYTTDGTTWTAADNGTFADAALTTEWATKEVAIPTTAKQIRFVATGIALDNIYGGTIVHTPVMKVTAADHFFGMTTEEATTTFTIENTGNATLTDIEVVASDANFTIEDAPASVEPKASATVTVKMLAQTSGKHSGTVTVSAPEQETVTFNVSGYVMDDDYYIETFNGNALPDGWKNESATSSSYRWSFANGMAEGSNTNALLTTPALSVEEGEKMYFEAKRSKTWNTQMIVYVSKDGGDFTELMRLKTNETNKDLKLGDDFKLFCIDGLEAGSYKIRFASDGAYLNAINGFTLDQNAPVFEMVTTGKADFGKLYDAPETKTYTVKNAGTGTMTVDIASDSEDFTVSPTQLNIAGGETADFTVSFNYSEGNYGVKQGTISVTPAYNTDLAYSFQATAKVMDPNLWDEDFEAGTLPTGWVSNNWTIGTFSSYSNTTTMALAPSSYTAGTLITPRLQAAEGDVLTWEAYFYWYNEKLKVEYSSDDQQTWTEIYNYMPKDDNVSDKNTEKDMQFTAPADGYYYLRFTSTYSNGVDNFNGFKLALKEHDAAITAQSIRATFTQYGNHTVSVTVKEMMNKDEELTAKFFINDTQYGETVTKTVAAGTTEEFEIPVTLTEIIEGNAYITVENENISLKTSEVAVTTKAATILDETTAMEEMPSGYQDKVVVKYTAKKGWNTICMPFALEDADLTALFGEGWKVYEFKGYNATSGLNFQEATRRYKGYPYIVYCEEVPEIAEPGYLLTYVDFKTTAGYDSYGGATFQGSYEPMAAGTLTGKYGVVPSTGRIQKAGESASLKGYRGYFELPSDANAAEMNITFTDNDGTVTTISALELINDLNAEAIYDLAGRKVAGNGKARLPQGVYIQNGKRFVVK